MVALSYSFSWWQVKRGAAYVDVVLVVIIKSIAEVELLSVLCMPDYCVYVALLFSPLPKRVVLRFFVPVRLLSEQVPNVAGHCTFALYII